MCNNYELLPAAPRVTICLDIEAELQWMLTSSQHMSAKAAVVLLTPLTADSG